jgi:glycosyltransferase involved in cell wall biosynthesis
VRTRLPTIAYRTAFLLAFVRVLRRLRPDAIHAHDVAMLAPGALAASATGALLLYDSHEYAPGVPYRKWLWGALVRALERVAISRADAVVTVSNGIAERLRERYDLHALPTVVRNLPDPAASDPDFAAPDLREGLGLDPGATLVIHLGAAALDRGCETLVRAMADAPDAHLMFLGVDDGAYGVRLTALAEEAGVSDRVHFRRSVPVGQIRAHVEQADIGVSLLEDTCENHRLALPNKVFEYLDAGIPVIASDLPEMRRALAGEPGAQLVDAAHAAEVAAALRDASKGLRRPGPQTEQWPDEADRLQELYARLGHRPAGHRSHRALVLVRNAVSHDARILRQADLLDSLGFDVTVAGVVSGRNSSHEERLGGRRVVRIDPAGAPRRALARLRSRLAAERETVTASDPSGSDAGSPSSRAGGAASNHSFGSRLRRLATTLAYYRKGIGLVRRLRPELIHANDYNTAWIGVAGKWMTGARLVYDSHELWPDRNLRPEPRAWLLLCEALFVRVADEVITTSPGYAEVLSRRYRIPPPRLIRNLPTWRVERGTDGDPARPPLAVYFGAITRNRGLTTALRALALAPELRMRFVGPEAWGYRRELERLAVELGVADRVELLEPVPPESAGEVLADADLGLALIEPACLSYEMTLPNKLYEYVAAGLPVLASEVPVLAAEVRRHGIGLTVDPGDPAAIATAIRSMLEPEARRDALEAVSRLAEEAAWETERERLAQVYGSPT